MQPRLSLSRKPRANGLRRGAWPERRILLPRSYHSQLDAKSRSTNLKWWLRIPPEVVSEQPKEDIKRRIRRLEAVLFLAREPVSSRKISELADLEDGSEVRRLIKRLNRHYDQMGRAYRAESIAGGYLLLTRPTFANWLRKLEHIPRQLRLSPPAFETLSVVAYRQPVTRAEIEAIRGVACGEILRQLMERDLVRISGRREDLGRPFLYSTTKHFLKSFGLNNLETLPGAERIRQTQLVDEVSSNDNQDQHLSIHDSD